MPVSQYLSPGNTSSEIHKEGKHKTGDHKTNTLQLKSNYTNTILKQKLMKM